MPTSSRKSGPSQLGRTVGKRQPKARIFAVCEGSKTEPSYLKAASRLSSESIVQLILVDDPATSPWELVERALAQIAEIKREARKYRDVNASRDEVWVVLDVDEHPRLSDACDRANAKGVRVAVSNPNVELWFLLHFQEQTAYLERSEALRALKMHVTSYDKSFPSLDPFLGKSQLAASRAQALTARHRQNGTSFPDDNPSSTVWALIEQLGVHY